MREVVFLALSLMRIVSAQEEEDEPLTKLCGQEFYDECARLTEEYGAGKLRREIADWEEMETVRGSPAKRSPPDVAKFRPLSLGVLKMQCCELGCNKRILLYTCH